MDSINRQQPEGNREDLTGPHAVEKIRDLVDKAKTCFFLTTDERGSFTVARPMNVRKVDDEGNLWFLSADDSDKNDDLMHDSSVQLFLQGSSHSDFLQLKGDAWVSRDRGMIEELWEPAIKTWFTEGKDDPRITVIRVSPTDGYYWDTKHGMAVAGIKMIIGAAIRKTLDDSVEGTIRP